jgi:hypothetical protein
MRPLSAVLALALSICSAGVGSWASRPAGHDCCPGSEAELASSCCPAALLPAVFRAEAPAAAALGAAPASSAPRFSRLVSVAAVAGRSRSFSPGAPPRAPPAALA